MPPHRFDSIAWGGCGVLGYVYAGAFLALREGGVLPTVQRASGVSSGGIFAVLCALRLSDRDIDRDYRGFLGRMIDVTNRELRPPCCSTAAALCMFYYRRGVYALEPILRPLRAAVLSTLAQRGAVDSAATDVDFATLYAATGVDLSLFAVSVETGREVRFSHRQHPRVSVFDALRASMSFVVAFPPCDVEGDLYVDGAIVNNFPLSAFDACSGDNSCLHPGTLGIALVHAGRAADGQRSRRAYGFEWMGLVARLMRESFTRHLHVSSSEQQHFSTRTTVVHAVDDIPEALIAPVDPCYVLRHALELYDSTLGEVTGAPPTRTEFRNADRWLHDQLGAPSQCE